jgi:hypothetical protein
MPEILKEVIVKCRIEWSSVPEICVHIEILSLSIKVGILFTSLSIR